VSGSFTVLCTLLAGQCTLLAAVTSHLHTHLTEPTPINASALYVE
jgi:hypothetical protein